MKPHIKQHFQQVDSILFAHIERLGDFELNPEPVDRYFYWLARSIAYQQLAGAAARTIWGRFEQLLPPGDFSPQAVVALSHDAMRSAGLSNAKASYIRNIAQAVLDGSLKFSEFETMSEEEIIANLTTVKGIGRWTAEMFLMFTLGRPDVFSEGDYGLRKGIQKVYGYKREPSLKTIRRIVKKWSPFKTYASMVLWEVLDTPEKAD